MDYEVQRNVSRTSVFRKLVPAGDVGTLSTTLASNGFITGLTIRFAAGESGTLHIRPIVVHPGNITVDLLDYADNGDKYVSGDDETIKCDLRLEIERKSRIDIEYVNTGIATSFINVDVEVTYFEVREPVNVIGATPRKGWF